MHSHIYIIVGEKVMNTVNQVKALKPHIAINVKDMEASVAFYTKMFGIKPAKYVRKQADDAAKPGRPRGYAKFDVINPPLNFTLNERDKRNVSSVSHLGIEVASTDDVITLRDRWLSAGLEVRDEMQVDCCYALQDKSWTADPDGNEWEVFVVLADTESASDCCAAEEDAGIADIVEGSCCNNSRLANKINHSNATCC